MKWDNVVRQKSGLRIRLSFRRQNMLTVQGIYDGQKVEVLENVPFRTKRKVLVTFLDEPPNITMPDSEIDPIRLLRGCSKNSNLTEKLLKSRKDDLDFEESKWKR